MSDGRTINPHKVYNVYEAARVLGVNEQTLLDYLRDGKIVGQKIGEWKILGQSLIDFLLTPQPNRLKSLAEALENLE